jgi:transposase-like protein
MKKSNKSSIYATVAIDEGVNYREIADMMTEIGFKMNHSSARNYVLRVMRKFADAITKEWDIKMSDERMDKIVKSPQFQQAICDILQTVEAQNNERRGY